jgi:hypothetical protein
MRPRQIIYTGGFLFLLICAASLFRLTPTGTNLADLRAGGAPSRHDSGSHNDVPDTQPRPPAEEPFNPNPKTKPAPPSLHPISHLVAEAEREHEKTLGRQSKTIDEAVREYRRRYQMPPPPNFDKWFEFAKAKGVQLIDEFDMVHEALTPFWGLKPATIRARAREALGFDNALLGLQIRNGKITHSEGGSDWQREATAGMMGKFLKWLPNMDLCFNLHDEPRVVVPHDDLSRLVQRAVEVNMPSANARAVVNNRFTENAEGRTEGTGVEENQLTRFNVFAHQPTWTHSRLSCSPASPARGLEEDERVDDVSKYGLGELGFIYNVTAMSDICYSPTLSSSFGFFDRPNAYNIVHDLFPIFSQSKISSYSDILYPSPWYWYEKVPYNEATDKKWSTKEDRLYWRGSTTGGFSRKGGWRRQHRQRFVQKVNAADNAMVLNNVGTTSDPQWKPQPVSRNDYKDLMDVYFSHVGQCDPDDCKEQKDFFTIKGHAEQYDAFKYKHLLDMDGNAFSGRFYAFLRSHSLVYKFAIFREWHLEWLRPWAHYIPLSLQGNEWLEAVRFFGRDSVGQDEAQRLANQQRDWANKVLRHEDMEVWFFRLLLEYGRVIDDSRDSIGFSLPHFSTVTTTPRSNDNSA